MKRIGGFRNNAPEFIKWAYWKLLHSVNGHPEDQLKDCGITGLYKQCKGCGTIFIP